MLDDDAGVTAGSPTISAHRSASEGYAAGRATRELLITTAQRLFAERGIDAVSLREVASAAGTRNTAAGQYYFGNKEALLLEIFRRHSPAIAAGRLAILERVPTSPDPVRTIAEAVIRPLADQISDAGFLTFLARCQSDHIRNDGVLGADVSGTFLRARNELRKHLADLPEPLFQRRFDLATKVVVTALAGVEWRQRSGREDADIDEVVLDLVDLVSAMVLAPSSRPPVPTTKGT